MALIKVDSDKLRNEANRLSNQIKQIENNKTQLMQLISELNEQWEGESAQAVINKMNLLVAKSNKTVSILKNYYTYIIKTIDRYDAFDKSASGRIKSSF